VTLADSETVWLTLPMVCLLKCLCFFCTDFQVLFLDLSKLCNVVGMVVKTTKRTYVGQLGVSVRVTVDNFQVQITIYSNVLCLETLRRTAK